jgi:hypothetical protein
MEFAGMVSSALTAAKFGLAQGRLPIKAMPAADRHISSARLPAAVADRV